MNLLKLSILTEKSEYHSKIDPLFLTFAGRLSSSSMALPTLVSALTLHCDSITSVSIGQEYSNMTIICNSCLPGIFYWGTG